VSVELTAFEVRIHEAQGSNDYSNRVVLSGECQNNDGYLFFFWGGGGGVRSGAHFHGARPDNGCTGSLHMF